MNIRTLLAPAALIIASFGTIHSASATEYRFIATDNSQETRLCVVAASNRLGKLKTEVSESAHSPRYQANSVRCNGASLAQFAHQYGADKTYRYLASHSMAKNKATENVTIRDLSASAASSSDEVVYVKVSSKQ